MNPLVTIYIGDFEVNKDAVDFMFTYEEESLFKVPFIDRILVIDADWLDLSRDQIKYIISNVKRKTLICTLDQKLFNWEHGCKLYHTLSDKKDKTFFYNLVSIFKSKDRSKLDKLRKNLQILPVWVKWLQCNVTTKNNYKVAEMLDRYVYNNDRQLLFSIIKHFEPILNFKWKYKKKADE
jgi:hypothetical protein